MSNLDTTTINATRAQSPDLTGVWDVHEHREGPTDEIQVSLRLGSGGEIGKDPVRTVHIPLGDDANHPFSYQGPEFQVGGVVKAAWANAKKSYVVTFTGGIIRPNVNNVNGTIIVGANLG